MVCLPAGNGLRQASTSSVRDAAISPRKCFVGYMSAITYMGFLREPSGSANAEFVGAAAIHTVTGEQVWACVGADWSEILL
jgi:hypothetical protein